MELSEFKSIMNKVVEDNHLSEQKLKQIKKKINSVESIDEKVRLWNEFTETQIPEIK